VKRVIDVLVAALALVALSPILLIVAVAIRFALGSPVLYRQTRPGLDGKPFEMMKFRSMSDGRDADGDPLPDEQRKTPFGLWLRSTSLDELPALLNVLRGDMSLVGPRPLLMEYLPLYSEEQQRRHNVRPGITGLAQVSGRNAISWERKFELDVEYVDNISLSLDLKILLRTVSKVLRREGISNGVAIGTEPFRGSNQ